MKYLIALFALVALAAATPLSPLDDALLQASDDARVAQGDAVVRALDGAQAYDDTVRVGLGDALVRANDQARLLAENGVVLGGPLAYAAPVVAAPGALYY